MGSGGAIGEHRDVASSAFCSESRSEIDPFDPVALEERLRDARARRERVIGMGRSHQPGNPQPQARPPSPIEPDRVRTSRRRRRLFMLALFVTGA